MRTGDVTADIQPQQYIIEWCVVVMEVEEEREGEDDRMVDGEDHDDNEGEEEEGATHLYDSLGNMSLMQVKKSFFKKTRKGSVLKLVHERYLRSDLECGYLRSSDVSAEYIQSQVSMSPHGHLLVIDTNVALHQIDVLEYDCPATSLIIILQTVLQELRNLNLSVYKRLMALLENDKKMYIYYPNELSSDSLVVRRADESINDANDRAIRDACVYFQRSLDDNGTVILLSNDQDNRKRASRDLHITSYTMRAYVNKFLNDYPELIDLLPSNDISSNDNESNELHLYTAHYPMSQILTGLQTKKVLKGVIRCNRNSSNDCYVILSKDMHGKRTSVKIQGHKRVNRAVDGDVVAIELMNFPFDWATEEEEEEDSRGNPSQDGNSNMGATIAAETADPTIEALEGIQSSSSLSSSSSRQSNKEDTNDEQLHGRVVGIIRRNWRQYAGSLIAEKNIGTESSSISSSSQFEELKYLEAGSEVSMQGVAANAEHHVAESVLFVPVDSRIPRVVISTRRKKELQGNRILVAIDHWPVNSRYPLGHYVRSLGKDGDKSVETQVLLHEFDVPHESFTDAVMSCLPPIDWTITEDIVNENGRIDLRHVPVVSIDPPGCKDIDDALHCTVLPNGNLEVGVHIADVTYFCEPETALDKEAMHRSTSTYLVERRLDMLPAYLTTQLCSLRSKEDHLAFSVVWEMDRNAKILDVKFFKSVIHSVASLTYDEAQAMLDDRSYEDKVSKSVRLLNMLAKIFRQKRIDEGALTLASPEVRFTLDSESQNPTDVQAYALKEANALVEEFMLLANITVSKKILRHFPSLGVLRRHQPPSREQFAPLLSAAEAVGVHIDITTSKTLADSLDAAVRPEDPYFNKLLRILSTRCMMPAQYFCSGEMPKDQWHHYGLAAPVYTHFTSPIRRYPDILVHRLLAAAIGIVSLPAVNADRGRIQDVCSHMNRRHRAAQHAQRASVSIHTLLFFKNKPAIEAAYILSVAKDNIVLLVPRFGVEDMVHVDSITQNLVVGSVDIRHDVKTHTLFLAGKKKRDNSDFKLSVQVFQSVKVRISVEEDGSGSRKLLLVLLNGKDEENVDDEEQDMMDLCHKDDLKKTTPLRFDSTNTLKSKQGSKRKENRSESKSKAGNRVSNIEGMTKKKKRL